MTDINVQPTEPSIEHEAVRPTDPIGRVLFTIARWFAIAGGFVLFGMGLLTTWSIIGRALGKIPVLDAMGFGPVLGDWELMQFGTAIVACCFLPYTQIVRGNVIVDFFLSKAPARLKAIFDFAGSLLFFIAIAFITWRHYYGGLDFYEDHQGLTTIDFEIWWAFPIILPLLGFLGVIILYTLWQDLVNIITGRAASGHVAEH